MRETDDDSGSLPSDAAFETGEDDDSDDASSLSSTPLIAIKRAKLEKQQLASKKSTTKKHTTATKSKASIVPKPVNKRKGKNATDTKDGSESNGIQAAKKSSPNSKKPSKVTKVTSKIDTTKDQSSEDDGGSESEEEEEEEEAACCLCHCGVDCSDRALFFPKDRKSELEEDEDYYFSLKDPYLDADPLYDRNNALVYCDTCNRLYHQKCHFVPILVVPRGEFHCLVCTIQHQQLKSPTSSSKKRGRKGTLKSSSSRAQPAILEKFLDRKITDQLFQTPPNQSTETLDICALEHQLEVESGAIKAKMWDRQFKQLKTFLKSQASNIRMANTTLETMTSTKRNRQHFLETSIKTGTKASQELAQTLCKLTGAKFKIREALLSLESLRTKNESISYETLYAWCENHPQHADHVFPFGMEFCKEKRRTVPRTRERTEMIETTNQNTKGFVPKEIVLSTEKCIPVVTKKKSKGKTADPTAKAIKSRSKKEEKKSTVTESDDDSGITLDDLKCSVCMIGDATDDNDVILCDGKDCHRAFHMKCVYPAVKPEDIENEDEDWFCPICYHSAELMGEIHQLCVGDDDQDDVSSGSWDDVHDVFPDSQWEYETALKFSKGKRNEDTQKLLGMFLGDDIHNNKKIQMPIGSDSEDENDYSLFDEDSFQERRRQEKEEESSNCESVASSEATLQEMDGVDYKVGKRELAALSEEECSGSESDEDEDDGGSDTKVRRSRRLGKKEEENESNPIDVGADFDEANIIDGKRKRKRVNYRKLNDMMFGDLTDHQQGMIDGGDDFDAVTTTKSKSKNQDSEDESENDNDSEDESQEGSDNESNGNSDGASRASTESNDANSTSTAGDDGDESN